MSVPYVAMRLADVVAVLLLVATVVAVVRGIVEIGPEPASPAGQVRRWGPSLLVGATAVALSSGTELVLLPAAVAGAVLVRRWARWRRRVVVARLDRHVDVVPLDRIGEHLDERAAGVA